MPRPIRQDLSRRLLIVDNLADMFADVAAELSADCELPASLALKGTTDDVAYHRDCEDRD